MNPITRFCICSLLSPAWLASTAAAQSEPGIAEHAREILAEHDDNGDGRLQRDELPAEAREDFAEADANADGALDLEELAELLEQYDDEQVPEAPPHLIGGAVQRVPVAEVPAKVRNVGPLRLDEQAALGKTLSCFGIEFAAEPAIADDVVQRIAAILASMFRNREGVDADAQTEVLRHLHRYGALLPVVRSERLGEQLDEDIIEGLLERHSVCDIIMTEVDESQRVMEIVEHLLHTVTDIGLHYAFPSEWGLSRESDLWQAMQRAIAAGYFDVSGYEDLVEAPREVHDRVLLQEFAYWVITSAWDLQVAYGPNEQEWGLRTPTDLRRALPEFMKVFDRTVGRVLAPPTAATLAPVGKPHRKPEISRSALRAAPKQPRKSGGLAAHEAQWLRARGAKVTTNERGFFEAAFGNGIVLVHVPAGVFVMGSEHLTDMERPVRKVHLGSYWIGKFPVTNEQFARFVAATDFVTDAEQEDAEGAYVYDPVQRYFRPTPGRHWRDAFATVPAEHPVSCVSWHDCVAYGNWLSEELGVPFALPTEAQWEKAGRGVDGRIYPWGNTPPAADRVNFCDSQFAKAYPGARQGDPDLLVDDGFAATSPVDAYPGGQSPYGVFDLGGNLTEWVHDWIDDYRADDLRDPRGPTTGDVRGNRGGMWVGDAGLTPASIYEQHNCRLENRAAADPRSSDDHLGFRLAVVLPVEAGREGGK